MEYFGKNVVKKCYFNNWISVPKTLAAISVILMNEIEWFNYDSISPQLPANEPVRVSVPSPLKWRL